MPSWPPLKIQLLSSSCESLVCRVLKLSGSGTASGLAAASGRAGGAGGEAGSEGSAGDGPGIRPAPGAAGDGEAGAGGASLGAVGAAGAGGVSRRSWMTDADDAGKRSLTSTG